MRLLLTMKSTMCSRDDIRKFEKMWCEILNADLNTNSPITTVKEKREKQAEYCLINKDVIIRKQAECYVKNREDILRKKAEYYEENRQEVCRKQAECYRENKDIFKKRIAAYYQQNREDILRKKRSTIGKTETAKNSFVSCVRSRFR